MLLKIKNIGVILSVIFILFVSCSKNNEVFPVNNGLELINSYKINVLEPSGLAINNDGTILYTVSDSTNKIYKLSTAGDVLQTFEYSGNDLEGISVFTNTKLLVVEERTKEVVEYDMETGNFNKHKIDYNNTTANSGLEGVAYNFNDETIFILNEKDPGLLIRLNPNYTIKTSTTLNFASDYSGVFHESATDNLWIVSDQSRTINKCNLEGNLIKSYPINVIKAEGIAVSNDKIYIVSDAEAKLYIFKKPV
ncbi:SdiA-regulated domain-containing protein [Lutibacter maritimus]|uniref:SdiA-regulated n=1 Tax=Lutibacter maritimus TaxID=593133 RepID=A0A1I6RIM8_9FLAO|nr:SdiA-regulated domain-containing protein [Lutibacter maritimus]SFS64562.1 SdiA-regulated [Lutibacter maritimus]